MARNLLTKWIVAACLTGGMTLSNAAPQLAAFTYQGQLKQAGALVNGARDFVFRLYGQAKGGQALGAPVVADDYPVSDGLFMVDLSFPQAFAGEQLWLEIEVGGVVLTPRQPVMATPVAQYALSGNPGPAGAQGETGAAGPQGEAGPAGAQGPVGAQGETGPAGAQGPTGPKGDTGAVGPAGPQGDVGPAGAQGPIGPAGPKGDTGLAGAQGAMGPKGDTGAAGPIGPQGPAGPIGPQGPAGAQGPMGPAGPKGDTGLAGAQGAAGPKGDTGPAGAQGAAGPQGDMGAAGPAGPQGAIGPAGAQGPAGPKGDAGPVGPAGPQGGVGPIGPQGPGTIFSIADSSYKQVGLYMVSKTEPAGNSCGSNMNCTYHAQCNAGDLALGGGVFASVFNSTFETTMRASYPGTDPSQWYFTIHNASFATATVRHYVSCIKFSN